MGSDAKSTADDVHLMVGAMAGADDRQRDLPPPRFALTKLIVRCSQLRNESKTLCEYNRDVRTLIRYVGKIQLLLESIDDTPAMPIPRRDGDHHPRTEPVPCPLADRPSPLIGRIKSD